VGDLYAPHCISIYWATPRIYETAQYESAKSERYVFVCVRRALLVANMPHEHKNNQVGTTQAGKKTAESDEMPDFCIVISTLREVLFIL